MEKHITIKSEYSSLEKILELANEESTYECKEDYDVWDIRKDENGQMEKCIFIKKSAMHGMKVYSPDGNSLKMTYIIPNKLMNAYFGKSVKMQRNILELVTGTIKDLVLVKSQKKAFEEMQQVFNKVIV